MFPIGFEWDEKKNGVNKQKHGISFDSAIEIFKHITIEKWILHSSGEERVVAIGKLNGRFITVIYTIRGVNKRIISVRKSRISEVKDYGQQDE